MSAMTPMGPSARLWTERRLMPKGPPLGVAVYDDGNGGTREICAADDPADLDWLVRSAAAFHRIPFEPPTMAERKPSGV